MVAIGGVLLVSYRLPVLKHKAFISPFRDRTVHA